MARKTERKEKRDSGKEGKEGQTLDSEGGDNYKEQRVVGEAAEQTA